MLHLFSPICAKVDALVVDYMRTVTMSTVGFISGHQSPARKLLIGSILYDLKLMTLRRAVNDRQAINVSRNIWSQRGGTDAAIDFAVHRHPTRNMCCL